MPCALSQARATNPVPRPLPTIEAITPPIRVTEHGSAQGWVRATQLLAMARARRDARLAAENEAGDKRIAPRVDCAEGYLK